MLGKQLSSSEKNCRLTRAMVVCSPPRWRSDRCKNDLEAKPSFSGPIQHLCNPHKRACEEKTKNNPSNERGKMNVGVSLRSILEGVKTSVKQLFRFDSASQIGARVFNQPVPDITHVPVIIRPPLKGHTSAVQASTKSTRKKRSPNAGKSALSIEEHKIILNTAHNASRRDSGEYDRAINRLADKFCRSYKTIKRIIREHNNKDKSAKSEGVLVGMKKRGRPSKVSDEGLREVLAEAIAAQENKNPLHRKGLVALLRAKAAAEAGPKAKMYAVKLRESCVKKYLRILKMQLYNNRKTKNITESRYAAQCSFRSAFTFWCMLMAFVVTNFTSVGINKTIYSKLIFYSDPTFLIAHPDPTRGKHECWVRIGAKNVKKRNKKGNTLSQSIKILSSTNAAGEQSEIVICKKISVANFKSNTSHPGIWRLTLPGYHPIVNSAAPKNGYIWIYNTNTFSARNEHIEARIASDFDKLIFQPFRQQIIDGSYGQAGGTPPLSVHMFDGEKAYLDMVDSPQYRAQCLAQNMLNFKCNAARSACENAMDVMSGFLTLKSLFRNNSILFDDNDPANVELKTLLDKHLNTEMTAPEGLKSMLKSVVPRLRTAMARAFTQHSISKGFLLAGIAPACNFGDIGTAWERVMDRCPGYDDLTQEQVEKFEALREEFVQYAKKHGSIPESEFDKHDFPQDLNYNPEALPKNLRDKNRRRAFIINHHAADENERVVQAARALIETNKKAEKKRQQNNKQIVEVLNKFADKATPNATQKNAADYPCSSCHRLHSGWEKVIKSRKKKDPSDSRWSWGKCTDCPHAVCSLPDCSATLDAHTAVCRLHLTPAITRAQAAAAAPAP